MLRSVLRQLVVRQLSARANGRESDFGAAVQRTVSRQQKLEKAECEATHAQASQMLRRVGLGGEPVTRRRSCASRCSCWPTPSPSPSLVAVALLACCAYIGSRMCRARRRRQDFRREIVVNEIARQFRTAEETRQEKREASTFAVNAISKLQI